MLKRLESLIRLAYVVAIGLAIYVVFFMPVGGGTGPTTGQDGEQEASVAEFDLYTYINGISSAKGTLSTDITFNFQNGDKLDVESTQQFESRGGESAITGTTAYKLNGDSLIMDDETYIKAGQRYSKTSTGFVVDDNIKLDGGNLNLGTIEEALTRGDNLIKEDGVSCYKLTGIMSYGDMSNELRNFIRAQGVNIADIDNVDVDITIYVTEKNVPYKFKMEFKDVGCTVKCKSLASREGTAKGSIVIAFKSFNSVDSISLPSDANHASEGEYMFVDKLAKYLSVIGSGDPIE